MKLRLLFAALAASTLVGCKAIAAAAGFVPVETVDGGPPASIIGLEEAAGVSGVASLLAVVGLNFFRNYTRAKALHQEGPPSSARRPKV